MEVCPLSGSTWAGRSSSSWLISQASSPYPHAIFSSRIFPLPGMCLWALRDPQLTKRAALSSGSRWCAKVGNIWTFWWWHSWLLILFLQLIQWKKMHYLFSEVSIRKKLFILWRRQGNALHFSVLNMMALPSGIRCCSSLPSLQHFPTLEPRVLTFFAAGGIWLSWHVHKTYLMTQGSCLSSMVTPLSSKWTHICTGNPVALSKNQEGKLSEVREKSGAQPWAWLCSLLSGLNFNSLRTCFFRSDSFESCGNDIFPEGHSVVRIDCPLLIFTFVIWELPNSLVVKMLQDRDLNTGSSSALNISLDMLDMQKCPKFFSIVLWPWIMTALSLTLIFSWLRSRPSLLCGHLWAASIV